LTVGNVAGPPEKLVPDASPESRLVLEDEQSALVILHPNSVLHISSAFESPINAYISTPPFLT
jgi:hypothetical protein